MVNKSISKIYLASKSPRRAELLIQMGVNFEILSFDIPEIVAEGETPFNYSQRICREKAEAGWQYMVEHKLPTLPILTADTEVIYQEQVLGKPVDYDDAFRMWRMFAGDRNLVITSVTLKYHDFEKTVTSQSWVHFDQLSDAEIHAYLATGDYKDKSGAYGIQSLAGQYIQKIDGCFYAIMGLPLNVVRNLLQELDANVK
ncbi:MAG: septum formation protein Maf [Neisseriaceae bacterium]|nr:MAG: septum formation protein Maf [Neisseriaceae bacterium]